MAGYYDPDGFWVNTDDSGKPNLAGYYDPDGFWVNTDDSGKPTGYIADPLNEQKGFGSGAGTNVVTDPSGVPSGSGFSGLTSILGQFKGVFDRLKSGNTTTADVNAALGVLGLIMPSLTAPKTAGWKGSIDLNRQFTRTPTAPIAYAPYSGQPVMGRQYFTSAYGAPGAPAPAPAAPGTGNPDLDNPSSTGGLAQGGIATLAGGGSTGTPRYLRGQTDGMADELDTSIDNVQPAKLSHGEFVIPADVVSHLGNGNSDAGAKVLYKMMDRVRQARTGTKEQGKEINPEKFTPGGIAGYAGGGAVAFSFGGTAGTTGTPTAPLGSSTETNISSWAGPYVGDMLSKTSALTNAPYQAWTGPLSAGYSPLQQQAFSGYGNLQVPGVMGEATKTAGDVAGKFGDMSYKPVGETFGASQAQAYMNPYLQAALDPQLKELTRQSDIARMSDAARLSQAGAFGGSRQAIMESEGRRNLLGEQADVLAQGYATAYDKAMAQFNADQARKIGEAQYGTDFGLKALEGQLGAAQAQSGLAQAEFGTGLQGLAAQLGAGATQRGIEQEGITEARKQFETEQLKPYTDLRFQKEMLSGLPVATAATTANTSTMGDIRGGLADLQKALDALGVG